MSTTPIIFDLLIVYSHHCALSASHPAIDVNTPFSARTHNQSYNLVYSYFLQQCAKNQLTAAFTTSADIIGPGLCSHYWTYTDKKWHKHAQLCTTRQVFDKFAPIDQDLFHRRQLFFSHPQLHPFNHPQLQTLFFDKHQTYQALAQYSLPTIALNQNNLRSYQKAKLQLQKLLLNHPHAQDFSPQIILKDRYGAGGQHIYKFLPHSQATITQTLKKHSQTQFILQPFLKFNQGYLYQNQKVAADIRLIHFNGKIIQSYIRLAQKGNFKCNEHQGGQLIYLPLTQIPTSVTNLAKKISTSLNYSPALYALDFLISNQGNVYFLEGNTSPGLDWNLQKPQNELESKKLIRLISRYFAEQKDNTTVIPSIISIPESKPTTSIIS